MNENRQCPPRFRSRSCVCVTGEASFATHLVRVYFSKRDARRQSAMRRACMRLWREAFLDRHESPSRSSQADADRCDNASVKSDEKPPLWTSGDELCSHSHLTRCDTARGSRETGGPCANANSPESLSLSLSRRPLRTDEPSNRPTDRSTNRPTDRPTERTNHESRNR